MDVTNQRESTALEDLSAVQVSTPIRVGPPAPGGAWREWCAQRRGLVPAGVDWSDPAVVLDLTGPVATVRVPTPAAATPVRTEPETATVPSSLVVTAAVAIVALNLLDILTTQLALAAGASEGNPIASLFVHHFPIFVAIKVLVPGMVALRMYVIRTKATPMLLAAMWWVVGVYSMVITINALHLLRS